MRPGRHDEADTPDERAEQQPDGEEQPAMLQRGDGARNDKQRDQERKLHPWSNGSPPAADTFTSLLEQLAEENHAGREIAGIRLSAALLRLRLAAVLDADAPARVT